jgi:FkbM family methyltransferase
MNWIKEIIKKTSGYWIHKLTTLPIGVDLFYDITKRLHYGPLNIAFDVGANDGQTVNWIKYYSPRTKIVAFEPVENTYNKLLLNIAVHKSIVAENIALGEKEGKQKIRLDPDFSVLNSLNELIMSKDPNAVEELITIDTLDNYCLRKGIDKIDLLKIDTEGYELKVLKGAEIFISEKKVSFIYCEVGFNESNTRNTSFEKLTTYLAERDYYFYALYHIDSHDWKQGNHLANALYIQKSIFP